MSSDRSDTMTSPANAEALPATGSGTSAAAYPHAAQVQCECAFCGCSRVSPCPEHEMSHGALLADNTRLREALTYYAEGRYPDGGETAREALSDA